jgi:hypothetical protein
VVNDRSHRLDTLGFFASGDTYRRQTANDGQYVSPTSSSEAFIWYGHLMQPNNAFVQNPKSPNAFRYYGPGQPNSLPNTKNDTNGLACDWILGRMAMLLTPIPPIGPPPDFYITASSPGALTPAGNPLAATAGSSDNHSITDARYDVVNTSLSAFAQLEASLPPAPPLPQPLPINSKQVVFRDPMIWFNAPTTPPGPARPRDPAQSAAVALALLVQSLPRQAAEQRRHGGHLADLPAWLLAIYRRVRGRLRDAGFQPEQPDLWTGAGRCRRHSLASGRHDRFRCR